MKIKLTLALSLVTILLCFFVNRFVHTDLVEDYLKQDIPIVTNYAFKGFEDKEGTLDVDYGQYEKRIESFDDLLEHSDIVIKANYIDREQLGSVFNTKISIEHVYKGDTNVKEVSFYEPVSIQKFDESLILKGGYLPLVKDKDYILFLKKEPVYEQEQYNLVSLYYGKFPNSGNVNSKIIESDKTYSYLECADFDFLEISMDQYKKDLEPNDIKMKYINMYEDYRDGAYREMNAEVQDFIRNQDSK